MEWFWILVCFGGLLAFVAREARCGVYDSVWNGLCFWFGWGFFRRFWRVKRDVGFVIQGFWWKMDPSPGPGP